MTQIGTKEIVVRGQTVIVRVFAPKSKKQTVKPTDTFNEDTAHALRLDAVYGENR